MRPLQQIDLRLVDQMELAVVDRAPQLGLDLQAVRLASAPARA